MKQKFVPEYEGELRKHALQIPRCISECSGIRVFGRRIKSLVFSTDVAIIKNINAELPYIILHPNPALRKPLSALLMCRCLPALEVAIPMGSGP